MIAVRLVITCDRQEVGAVLNVVAPNDASGVRVVSRQEDAFEITTDFRDLPTARIAIDELDRRETP